ncbi:MAG: sulfate adenylyltransferase subunit CysN [Myxococcota bacterium]|nr:sulfate adenylyltransferase subunit CysN [Myxococcota bacterium]
MRTQAEEDALIQSDIHTFLEQNQQKELLRFVTVGSVDDGKSTLIGRLLHDTKGVYDDQLKDATRTTETGEQAIDFARITDGLRAEREQGITIDVAYRYFSTPSRKFIIADTPGHVQYTRNMATGASTAHVALILIDARLGVLTQSRRHSFIASLLGIPNLLVCINKMDLADYSEERFNEIVEDFLSFAKALNFQSISFVPVSALFGINIVTKNTQKTPWYSGPSVLEFLETVEISNAHNMEEFRMPVQVVLRPNLDYRGYAGQIVSGVIRKGDDIAVYPSGKQSTVAGIDTYDGELEVAYAPMSITLRLNDEIDISRGDTLASPKSPPQLSRRIEAMVVWMNENPLDPERSYWIKHGTRYVHINIEQLCYKVNLDDLTHDTDITELKLNDIARIQLQTHRPLAFDPYQDNRSTGAFIIIDYMSNTTVGAGMIQSAYAGEDIEEANIATLREARLQQQGHVIWLTGLPAAGCSTLAGILERQLFEQGQLPTVIDSDPRYPLLSSNDVALLAARMADSGLLTICAVPAPDSSGRELAIRNIGNARCSVVHVSTPSSICQGRDTQDRYASGTPAFEKPENPTLSVDLSQLSPEEAATQIIQILKSEKIIWAS